MSVKTVPRLRNLSLHLRVKGDAPDSTPCPETFVLCPTEQRRKSGRRNPSYVRRIGIYRRDMEV